MIKRVCALAIWLALVELASAHGPADWISKGSFKNAVGELCCGERDCAEFMDEGTIIPKADGWHVNAIFRGGYETWEGGVSHQVPIVQEVHEVVPYSEAQPSPDGRFWRCEWSGSRKCFFAPPPSM